VGGCSHRPASRIFDGGGHFRQVLPCNSSTSDAPTSCLAQKWGRLPFFRTTILESRVCDVRFTLLRLRKFFFHNTPRVWRQCQHFSCRKLWKCTCRKLVDLVLHSFGQFGAKIAVWKIKCSITKRMQSHLILTHITGVSIYDTQDFLVLFDGLFCMFIVCTHGSR